MAWHIPDEYLHLVEDEQVSHPVVGHKVSPRLRPIFRIRNEPWHGSFLDTDISSLMS